MKTTASYMNDEHLYVSQAHLECKGANSVDSGATEVQSPTSKQCVIYNSDAAITKGKSSGIPLDS